MIRYIVFAVKKNNNDNIIGFYIAELEDGYYRYKGYYSYEKVSEALYKKIKIHTAVWDYNKGDWGKKQPLQLCDDGVIRTLANNTLIDNLDSLPTFY